MGSLLAFYRTGEIVSATITAVNSATSVTIDVDGGTGSNLVYKVGHNNSPAIQACIDLGAYGTYQQYGPTELPAGDWAISGLDLGYGDAFKAFYLKGTWKQYRAADLGPATALHHLGPLMSYGVNFQGVRTAGIEKLTIVGLLNLPIRDLWATAQDGIDAQVEANWDALGGESRYAPYGGVVTDARAGVAQSDPLTSLPDHYADLAYPTWTGVSGQYGKRTSSDISLDDVYVIGFNVGVCQHPCSDASNGDFYTYDNVKVDRCKYGWSVGNGNSRIPRWNKSIFGELFYGFTNIVHGPQNGTLGGNMTDIGFGQVVHMFKLDGTQVLGMHLHGYGERIWDMGTIDGATSAAKPISFSGNWAFSLGLLDKWGPPAYVLKGTHNGPITFDNATVTVANVAVFEPSFVVMRNSQVANIELPTANVDLYIASALTSTCGGFVTLPLNALRNQNMTYVWYDKSDAGGRTTSSGGVVSYANTGHFSGDRPGRDFCIPFWESKVIPHGLDFGPTFPNPAIIESQNKASLTSFNLVGRELTLEFSSLQDRIALREGKEPGDWIYDQPTGSVFFIHTRNGAVLQATLMNNYKHNQTETWEPITATGTIYFVNTRIYTLERPVFGNVSSSSNIITVTRNAQYIDEIQPGDLIYSDPQTEETHANSAMTVVSVDAVAGTIQMEGNALVDRDDVPLRYWIRQPMANL